jgi:excisionase family DNA binding protein
MLDKLLTPEEAATALGVQVGTVRVWAAERRIPTIRVGRLLRFRVADVQAWLEEHRAPAEWRAPRRRAAVGGT